VANHCENLVSAFDLSIGTVQPASMTVFSVDRYCTPSSVWELILFKVPVRYVVSRIIRFVELDYDLLCPGVSVVIYARAQGRGRDYMHESTYVRYCPAMKGE